MIVRPRTFTLQALFFISTVLHYCSTEKHYDKEDLLDLGHLGGEETIGVFRFKVPVKTVTVTKTYGVPIPVPYPIRQEVPVPVHVTKPVLVPVPHAVHIPHPVPVIKTVAVPAPTHNNVNVPQGHVADSSSIVPGIIALPYPIAAGGHGQGHGYGIFASPVGLHRFLIPTNGGNYFPHPQATDTNLHNQSSYKTDDSSNDAKVSNDGLDKRNAST